MPKVLVLYYSAYGHIEQMAQAVADGAREAGAVVDIKRVPELVPEELARKSGMKLEQDAPFSLITNMMHFGMVIVGLPYSFAGQMRMDEITGGSPYGATTIAGRGDRQPSVNELESARFQGKHVAEVAAKLFG
jgi:multimeric flavodoxin WrbA